MALTAATLQAACKAAIITEMNLRDPTADTDLAVDGDAYRDRFAEAVAKAVADTVVAHIKDFAVVNTTVTVVTSCPAGVGSGTGTGVGTVT